MTKVHRKNYDINSWKKRNSGANSGPAEKDWMVFVSAAIGVASRIFSPIWCVKTANL